MSNEILGSGGYSVKSAQIIILCVRFRNKYEETGF